MTCWLLDFSFSFILSVLLVPGITGAATTPRWALVALALPLLARDWTKSARLTTPHLFGLLFLAYAALSLAWTAGPLEGPDALAKLLFLAMAFDYGARRASLRPLLVGFGLGMWVNSFVVVTGLAVPNSGINTGLFVNPNSMGEIAGLVLVAVAVERQWWLIPGILPAFLMANCRGAYVAVGAALVWWLWRRVGRNSKVLIALTTIGIAASLPFLGNGIRGEGGVISVGMRLQMWADVLPHLTFFGRGLGSFYQLFPYYATMDTLATRPEHLHNDWLEYLFETGAGSVFLFALLWSCRSVVLLCFVVEACFGFTSHIAATGCLAALVAGHDTWHRHGLRHDLAAWRISLRAWLYRLSGWVRHRRVAHGEDMVSAVPYVS